MRFVRSALMGIQRPGVALAACWCAVMVALGALAVAAHDHFTHGMAVKWYAKTPSRSLVTRSVERSGRIPDLDTALSRYVNGWDYEAHGVPDRIPKVDATIHMVVTVPPGVSNFEVHASGTHQVSLMNAKAKHSSGEQGSTQLNPGEHQVTIRWRSPTLKPNGTHWNHNPPVHLTPQWVRHGKVEPIPRSAMAPPSSMDHAQADLIWVVAGLCALLCALALLRALVRRPFSHEALALLLLVGIAGALRFHDYDLAPGVRENDDEYFATWNGWQLLRRGTTVGWTGWAPSYTTPIKTQDAGYWGTPSYEMVTPYFEHPPLSHLLFGAAAHLGGAKHFLHAKLIHTRIVPIVLSLISLALLFVLAKDVFKTDHLSVWLALLLYAFIPVFVIQHRTLKEEALLTPLILGATLCVRRLAGEGKGKLRWALATGTLCGIAAWTKIPGVAFVIGFAALAWRWRRPSLAVAMPLMAVAVASTMMLYAWAHGWSTFWDAIHLQSQIRGAHWNVLLVFFDSAKIIHNKVGIGWVLFLWMGALVHAVTAPRQATDLLLPSLVYIIALAIPAGSWYFGWYLLPVAPFLCLASAKGISRLWRRDHLLFSLMMVGTLATYGLAFMDPIDAIHHADPDLRQRVTRGVLLLCAPFFIAVTIPHRWTAMVIRRAALVATILVWLWSSVRFVHLYPEVRHTHENLDTHRTW